MSAVQLTGILSAVRSPHFGRAVGGLAAAFVIVTALAWGILSLIWPDSRVHVNVRWKPAVTDARRVELERRFRLTDRQYAEGTTWRYQLADSTTANIRAIVQNDQVDDTEHLNRVRYRPEFAQDRSRQLLVYSLAIGSVGACLLFGLAARSWQTGSFRVPSSSELVAAAAARLALARARRSTPRASTDVSLLQSRGLTGAVLVAAILASVAMAWFAGAALWSATAALLVVYACGYLVGSLLVDPVETPSWAVIRTITGLLLTALSFLLSLVLSLPWSQDPSRYSPPPYGSADDGRLRGRAAWSDFSGTPSRRESSSSSWLLQSG